MKIPLRSFCMTNSSRAMKFLVVVNWRRTQLQERWKSTVFIVWSLPLIKTKKSLIEWRWMAMINSILAISLLWGSLAYSFLVWWIHVLMRTVYACDGEESEDATIWCTVCICGDTAKWSVALGSVRSRLFKLPFFFSWTLDIIFCFNVAGDPKYSPNFFVDVCLFLWSSLTVENHNYYSKGTNSSHEFLD